MYGSIVIQRAWQKMLSGRRLDVIDPSPLDIEIGDIAHGLAFQARWNGQTQGDFVFSVANHSILVWNIFSIENPKIEKKWQLVSLLHDAPEYVIGDLISPVKKEVGSSYINLEKKLQEAIHIRFGLPALVPDKIKSKPFEINDPSDGSVIGTPTPKKLSVASIDIE